MTKRRRRGNQCVTKRRRRGKPVRATSCKRRRRGKPVRSIFLETALPSEVETARSSADGTALPPDVRRGYAPPECWKEIWAMPLVRATPLGQRPNQGRSPLIFYSSLTAGRSPASHQAAEPSSGSGAGSSGSGAGSSRRRSRLSIRRRSRFIRQRSRVHQAAEPLHRAAEPSRAAR